VYSHVITYGTVSRRAIRRHTDPIESLGTRVGYVPALIPSADMNPPPQLIHGVFVGQVEIIHIKPTKITFDLKHTLITPVIG
jgi:hypothetical protein